MLVWLKQKDELSGGCVRIGQLLIEVDSVDTCIWGAF